MNPFAVSRFILASLQTGSERRVGGRPRQLSSEKPECLTGGPRCRILLTANTPNHSRIELIIIEQVQNLDHTQLATLYSEEHFSIGSHIWQAH